ncbi:MAG: lyase family protein [Acidimicrobiia bacterium]
MIDPGFTTTEMEQIFSPARRVAAFLEFEAALALALGDVGIAPEDAAGAVAEACATPLADPEAVLAATWVEGTPLIPMLTELRSRLSASDAEWVHYGATTQDAVDTAAMIQAGHALEVLDGRLTGLARRLAPLVLEHRDQPQTGRTFLQHARPTTFGVRLAGWLDPIVRQLVGLRETRGGLVVQLGGPVGNLAAFGERGTEVMEALARRLGLEAPNLPWHTDRSRIFEIAAAVALVGRTMGKIGLDIALLAQSDVGEIRVRAGGSSSMGDKRNPIDAIRAIAAAEACGAAAGMVANGPAHELDRGLGGWHVESIALPMLFKTASAAAESIGGAFDSLEVDTDRMTLLAGPEAKGLVLDPRMIDRVIADFDDVVGDG